MKFYFPLFSLLDYVWAITLLIMKIYASSEYILYDTQIETFGSEFTTSVYSTLILDRFICIIPKKVLSHIMILPFSIREKKIFCIDNPSIMAPTLYIKSQV